LKNNQADVKPRFYVPKKLVKTVLFHSHGMPLSGHLGRTKTTSVVTARFYWKHMDDDIRAWVKGCLGCQRRKTCRPARQGRYKPIYRSSPHQLVAIDIVGPFPETADGYMYVLTIMDIFTRWPTAVPLRDKSAKSVAIALMDHYFTIHGMPTTIMADNGREFDNTLLHELAGILNIDIHHTIPIHPQQNGHIERFHRYLNASLSIFAHNDQKDWVRYLQPTLFAYRISTNASTGFSPYEMMFGRQAQTPLDLIFGLEPEQFKCESEWVEFTKTSLKSIFNDAWDNQVIAAERNKSRSDSTREDTTFTPGDKVLLWEPMNITDDVDNLLTSPLTSYSSKLLTKVRTSRKLKTPWTGPHIIIEKLGRYSYNVQHCNKVGALSEPKRFKVHVDRLCLAKGYDSKGTPTPTWEPKRQPHTGEQAPEPSEDDNSEDSTLYFPSDTNITVGKLVCIAFDDPEDPFGIGRITKIGGSDGKKITVHWYGNHKRRTKGTYKPAWVLQKPLKKKKNGSTCVQWYYNYPKPQRQNERPYTSADTGQLHRDNITLVDFQLSDQHHLPSDLWTQLAKVTLLEAN
jgi:hypothetical protein